MTKKTHNDPRADRQPVPDCRYYGLFAVNKKDPTDILGYVENSFSMGWSKNYVNLEEGFRDGTARKAADAEVRYFEKEYPTDEEFAKWFYECQRKLYKPGMTVADMRQAYWESWYKMKKNRLLAQNVWNIVGERARVPAGYELKVFRIGSKNCPVDVDLRYRIAVRRKWTKEWDKWKWRNAPFKVKANNAKPWEDIYPTVADVLNAPKSEINCPDTGWQFRKSCPRIIKCKTFEWPRMSRAEMKRHSKRGKFD